jgi:cysteine synthase A
MLSQSTRRFLSYQLNTALKTSDNGFLSAIGNTPLLKLNKLSNELNRNIYAKAEWMNPGGSIKDRAALFLLELAEKRGEIKPGATIVEGTAGNTGIGLAHICRAKGYKLVIYLPDTMAKSKIDILRVLGAEVFPVPVVPFHDPGNFNQRAKRHAESLENGFWTNQFDNLDSRLTHIESTGPEIWNQLNGKIDVFTCASGTGGTWSGVTKYLKTQNPKIKSIITEPPGASLYTYVKTGGKSIAFEGTTFVEGAGQQRVTNNVQQEIDTADDSYQIPDQETISMLYRLLDDEGIFVGTTSALNVAGAVRAAKEAPESSNIVTILPDASHKYIDRLFSKSYLQNLNIYDGIPDNLKKYAHLD